MNDWFFRRLLVRIKTFLASEPPARDDIDNAEPRLLIPFKTPRTSSRRLLATVCDYRE